jgi:hypothetical protein
MGGVCATNCSGAICVFGGICGAADLVEEGDWARRFGVVRGLARTKAVTRSEAKGRMS